MNRSNREFRIIIIVSVAVLVVLGIVLTIIGLLSNKNPYGDSIAIQNYDEKVKNLSQDYEDIMSSQLYKIVQMNSDEEVDGSSVKDAFIRNGSDTQDEVVRSQRYKGAFIVDIESLKQSYLLQYLYSTRENDPFTAGYPIVISCVDPEDVKYEDFDCKDDNAGAGRGTDPVDDPIITFLPYSSFSYSLKADATGDSVILYADLNIPQSSLKGDTASRQQIVQLYKSLVTNWIKENGLDPADYTIKYNYTDTGERIIEDNYDDAHFDE